MPTTKQLDYRNDLRARVINATPAEWTIAGPESVRRAVALVVVAALPDRDLASLDVSDQIAMLNPGAGLSREDRDSIRGEDDEAGSGLAAADFALGRVAKWMTSAWGKQLRTLCITQIRKDLAVGRLADLEGRSITRDQLVGAGTKIARRIGAAA
jgi:hypothetical protein